jgi:hypothetical protein
LKIYKSKKRVATLFPRYKGISRITYLRK